MFQEAVKFDAKGRVALVGPPGSGKSYTLLTLARELAGPDGRIAAIDTEHGSLSKYADLFKFQVVEFDSFAPDNFLKGLAAAEKAKFDVFCCDSLSHFWMGKDGALEFVDTAAKRKGDSFAGWKDFRPHERSMVDAMIASPCHIIVTMRTKTDYVEDINPNTGKKIRRKVGLAPVQREGLEYEFDLVAYMDDDNTFITDKTRCPFYTAKAITKPYAKDFAPFVAWLKGAKKQAAVSAEPARQEPPRQRAGSPNATQEPPPGVPVQSASEPPPQAPFQPSDNDIPAEMGGTFVNDQGPTAEKHQAAARQRMAAASEVTGVAEKPWTTFKGMLAQFSTMREKIGDGLYYKVLAAHKVQHSKEFKSGEAAQACFLELSMIARNQREAA